MREKTHIHGGYLCFTHPGVRDKRRWSEIELSQPRHETAFGDVTMGQSRRNQPIYSSLTFNRDLWACRYLRQSMHVTNILCIDTCTFLTDIFYNGRSGVLAGDMNCLDIHKTYVASP